MSSAAATPVDPLRIVTALTEMGHVDTVYRDVYLERARSALGGVLPLDEFRFLELAILNQTDRFSLAIDALDRMPRYRVAGSSVREALLDQQVACKGHAYEHGVDPAHITNWQWPF